MFRLDPMTQDDVPEVSRVERRCFTNPWPATAYRRELRVPEQNHYAVLREIPDAPPPAANGHGHGRGDGLRPLARLPLLPFGRRGDPAPSAPPTRGRIVGFVGMWTMYDEAHITTIGIDPDFRGRGLGELLLVALFDEAARRAAAWLTLEVRVSNEAAQALYRKHGFTVRGQRKRYYSDNNEDAYIMWSASLADPDYAAQVRALRRAIVARFPGVLGPEPEPVVPVVAPPHGGAGAPYDPAGNWGASKS